MAPFIYPSPKREEPRREAHCFGGHEYREIHHWQCYGCNKWFDESVAHGCSYDEPPTHGYSTEKRQIFREKVFLLDKRNDEIKQAWKKSQYAKVKGQFRI
jgi:hypothetical protein